MQSLIHNLTSRLMLFLCMQSVFFGNGSWHPNLSDLRALRRRTDAARPSRLEKRNKALRSFEDLKGSAGGFLALGAEVPSCLKSKA